jgi:hypothetical protein
MLDGTEKKEGKFRSYCAAKLHRSVREAIVLVWHGGSQAQPAQFK